MQTATDEGGPLAAPEELRERPGPVAGAVELEVDDDVRALRDADRR